MPEPTEIYRKLQARVHKINFKGDIPLEEGCNIVMNKNSLHGGGTKRDRKCVLIKILKITEEEYKRKWGYDSRDYEFDKKLLVYDIEVCDTFWTLANRSKVVKNLGKPLTLDFYFRALKEKTQFDWTSKALTALAIINFSKPISSQSEDVNNKLIKLLS